MSDELKAILEDVELAERFAMALRFHGQPERAAQVEADAAKRRGSAEATV